MNHHHAIPSLSLCFLIGLGAFASTALGQNNSEIFAEISGDPRAGSDGDLVVAAGQTVEWTRPGDDTSIYRFSSINIGAGATLKIRANHPGMKEGRPLYFLVNGPVVIDGTIDLNGEKGGDCLAENYAPTESTPGAGGYAGGRGQIYANPLYLVLGTPGRGPGYGIQGQANASHVTGHRPYGNIYLRPLVGGSGGSPYAQGPAHGGVGHSHAGGGAGGGAILIASSDNITLNGAITAAGGNGGNSGDGALDANDGDEIPEHLQGLCNSFRADEGFAGSGGAIRLLAPTISGQGQLDVEGGRDGSNDGQDSDSQASYGRTRLESNAHTHTISTLPQRASRQGRPSPTGLQAPAKPKITVLSVDGVDVRANPDADSRNPDVFFANPVQAMVRFETENVPMRPAFSDVPSQTIVMVVSEDAGVTLNVADGWGIVVDPDFGQPNTNQRARFVAPVTFQPGHSQIYVWIRW